MVLKKSNSALNSGATQRGVSHKKITRVHNLGSNSYYMNCGAEEVIRVFMSYTRSPVTDNDRPEIWRCVNMVEDYLDWQYPHDTVLQTEARARQPRWNGITSSCEYSLHKHNAWHLPGRIKTMMADREFLSSISSTLNLKVNHIQEIPKIGRVNTYRNKKTDSMDVLAQDADCEAGTDQKKKTRVRHTYHGRGVQRPHLFQHSRNAQKPSDMSTKQTETPTGSLELTVCDKFHLDVRCVSSTNLGKKITGDCSKYSRLRSLTKGKSYVNGKRSFERGYTQEGIREDEECYALDQLCEYHEPMDFDSDVDICEITSPDVTAQAYNITDFLTEPRVRQKKRKKSKGGDVSVQISNFTDVTQDGMVKYPKGSCIFVPSDEVPLNESTESWDLIPQTMTSDENESGYNSSGYGDHTDGHVVEPAATLTAQELMEEQRILSHIQFEQEMNTFDNSYTQLSLQLSDKDIENYHVVCDHGEQNFVYCGDVKYKMMTGSSESHCFVINLHDDESPCNDQHAAYLIGREMGSNKSNKSWLVSVVDHARPELTVVFKERLEQMTALEGKKDIELSALVQMAIATREFVENNKISEHAGDLNLAPSSSNCKVEDDRLTKAMASHRIWLEIPQAVPRHIHISTAGDALQLINDKNTDSQNSSAITKPDNVWEVLETECTICLIPFNDSELSSSPVKLLQCHHVFCTSCWRAHAYHSMREGAAQIQCMGTKCSSKMDAVTAMTLLPASMISQWQTRVRDRFIDTSPFCNWCPSDSCDKVAVSTGAPLRSQFGSTVVCDCEHSWCGSCLKQPHWPASCEQAAQLRILLNKFGMDAASLDVHSTNYYVKLKPCPKCNYPIEKNEGCPSMVCRMCWYNFCWNCLKSGDSHNLYQCKERSDNFITYNLQNQLHVPLQYFPQLLTTMTRKKNTSKMKTWLRNVQRIKKCTVRLPVNVACLHGIETSFTKVADLAGESLKFVLKAMTIQETWYTLLCFAHLKKKRASKILTAKAVAKLAQLDFVVWRLEENILGKSFAHICKRVKTCEGLLHSGDKVLSELAALAPMIQNVTRDVDTAWVGKLDPKQTMRYK